ncbi:MAG: glycerol kinase [Nevskiales bacterium]
MNTWLAIDQGGHASRAILFDATGNRVDEAFAPVATRREGADRVEHEPEELIASLRDVIDAVCVRAARAGLRITAAGLASQRSSMVCWDRRDGTALSPVISWQDRRHAAWLERLAPRREWIRERTGLALTPHYGASKMRWCLEHLPAVQAAAAAGTLAMGPLAAFILHRLLVGRPLVVDPANASRTQLWDPRSRDWSDELLALFGIPRACLPHSVTSRYAFGELDTPAGPVPLTVATGDQSAVPFAFGPLATTTLYVNAGTGAFVQRAIRDHLPEAPRLLASVVWSDASGVDYMLEGTVNGAGSALDWFAARVGVAVTTLLADATAPDVGEPPLFLNAVSGLGSPFWTGALEPRFMGGGSRAAQALAVLESIVFLIAVNIEELAPHGPRPGRLVLAGGITSTDDFCQRLADLAGLPAWRSRESEATARGLAFLLAGAPRNWDEAPGDHFQPRANPGLAGRYRRWREAVDAALTAAGTH